MGKGGGKVTTREILDRLAAIVQTQAETWPRSARVQFQATHAALVSRYRTGNMLKSGMKTAVVRWVEAVEAKGPSAAIRPPAITEAWFVPLKSCSGCGTEVGEDSFLCRSCHTKHFLTESLTPEQRKERSRQAGKVRGAALRARREVAGEYERRLALLGARERAVAEAEARLVPYRPPHQLRLPFPRRGKGFDGLGRLSDHEKLAVAGAAMPWIALAATLWFARNAGRP